MKQLLQVIGKYILILIVVFLILLIFIFSLKFFPLFKISAIQGEVKNYFVAVLIPSFFHSIYNTFLLSFFLFCNLIFNYEKKNKLILFSFPVLFSTIIIFVISIIFKPDYKTVDFFNIKDARIYFQESVFFEHGDSKYFFREIKKDNVKYIIEIENYDDFDFNFINSLSTTYGSSRKFEEFTLYFNSRVNFIEDNIIIEMTDENNNVKKEKFVLKEMREYNIASSFLIRNFSIWLRNFTFHFILSKNIYINVLIWFSTAFLVMTLMYFIKLSHYPFLSVACNFILLGGAYFFIYYLFDFYLKLFVDLIDPVLIGELLLCVILIVVSLIFNGIKLLFFKDQIWER